MPARHPDDRALAIVAAVSGLYDITLGSALLAGRGLLTALFAVPAPAPPIHADLNGLFLLAVGVGYVLPFRSPDRYRGYLWVMGPLPEGIRHAWRSWPITSSATRRRPTWRSPPRTERWRSSRCGHSRSREADSPDARRRSRSRASGGRFQRGGAAGDGSDDHMSLSKAYTARPAPSVAAPASITIGRALMTKNIIQPVTRRKTIGVTG